MANYTIDEIMNTINGINNKYIQTTYNFIISQGEGVIDAMYDQIKKNSGSNKRESRGRDGSKEEN